jgi:predicted tellurium resistance membrane protein TerC
MDYLLALAADPNAWAALVTLTAMEVVLGIDNLIFISILTNKLPEHQRARARQVGIGAALVLRLALLGTVAIIVRLTDPVVFGLSWRDMILIGGGLFLCGRPPRRSTTTWTPTTAPTCSSPRSRRPARASPRPSARFCCWTSCSPSTASSPRWA